MPKAWISKRWIVLALMRSLIQGWDKIAVATQKVEIELEAGKNFIYLLKMDSADSGIFQVDYIDATFVSELVDTGVNNA